MSELARPELASPPSNVDPRLRLAQLADQCVLCGLCLPHCPTYALDQVESESPRGRISLIHALAEERIDADTVDFTALEHCLSCRRCESVCPSGVQYGALLDGARAWLREQGSLRPGFRQRAVAQLLARPAWLDRCLGLARPVWGLLPQALRAGLPKPPPQQRLRTMRIEASRGEVALFLGCVARRYANSAQQAAIDLMQGLGWQVQIPASQTCCGAQARHSGDALLADRLAARNQAAFATSRSVLTLDSGCHESVADACAEDARDILDWLAEDAQFATLDWRSEAESIAVYAPCTQRNVVGSDQALRRLLALLPGVQPTWLHAGCCGAAGDHMLRFSERADALRRPLLDQLAASGCQHLLVANIGCRLHLQAGIDARGLAVRVLHPVEYFKQRLRMETA